MLAETEREGGGKGGESSVNKRGLSETTTQEQLRLNGDSKSIISSFYGSPLSGSMPSHNTVLLLQVSIRLLL